MQISEQSGVESLAIVFPFMKNEIDDWISRRKRPERITGDDNMRAFPVTAPEELACLKLQTFERFKASMITAKDFYLNAVFFNGSHSSPLIAFFLHQAVELTYRSVLIALSGGYKKTHELLLLRKEADRFAPGLNSVLRAGTPEEKRLIGLLDKAYTAARYDADFTVSPEDIAGLTEDAAMLLEVAETLVAAGLNVNSNYFTKAKKINV